MQVHEYVTGEISKKIRDIQLIKERIKKDIKT